jgi:hypothetical protein
MPRTRALATIGAGLAAVLFGVVAWILISGEGTAPWNEAGDPQKFIGECYFDLRSRGALEPGNTPAQLKSGCKCLAEGFYPLIAGKSREEAAKISMRPEILEQVRTLRKKCAYQVGLDGIEQWWD